MKRSCLICIFFMLFILSGVRSQTYTHYNQLFKSLDPNVISTNQNSEVNFGASQSFDKTITLEIPNFNDNEIFITQVGVQNKITTNIASTSSKVNLIQNGDLNSIDLNITVKSYLNNIDQIGENNNVFENIYAPSADISLNLSQNGTNNLFERYGSNSIGDKIEFNMNGNNKAIIVRNFK